MTSPEPDIDVGIIGGGPAGAAIAAYLARAGITCGVFEGELFPRPHVGESLVPASTRVLKDLGFLDQMEQTKFPHKFGSVWTATADSPAYEHRWQGLSADSRADIRFEEREQPGVDQNYTYHVDRGKFDLLLLQHAYSLGAKVCEGVRVVDVDFSEAARPEIRFSVGGRTHSVRVRIVVDASGRQTFLGNRLRLKVKDPVFDQFAIHTWFDGFDRGGGDHADFLQVYFLPITNSWVWQIPINDTITSFGVVTQKKNFRTAKQGREQFFWDCVASRPDLLVGLRSATQIRPFTEEGDYSYAMKEICGDGFVMIGDAARFVDPIFSSGVSIALNGARFAAPAIMDALERGDTTKAAFKEYEALTRRGTKNWYDFIRTYYRLNVLFTAYLRDPRYRLDILKLMQGDVYDDEQPAVLAEMREMIRGVESNPKHIWHRLLGDLTANAFAEAF